MIKQYNFPVIFQNVIGEVIPHHILQRRENINLDNNILINDAQSITTSSNPRSEISNRKFLRTKSKKKELQRRSKMMKTMNCFTYLKGSNQQNHHEIGSNPKFINFLKKKLANSDSGGNPNDINFEAVEQDPIKQLSSLQSEELANDPQLRKNHFRIRTSLDRASIEEEMYQSKYEQISSEDVDSYPCDSKRNRQFQDDQVIQDKYFMKNQPVTHKAVSHKAKTKGGLGNKFSDRLNETKKKTVNFTIAQNDNVSEEQDKSQARIKFSNSKRSREQSSINTRRSKFTRKETKFSQKSEKSMESRWTDRTVISIKFSQSNQSVKSKKSLRSNESILNQDQMNLVWVKGIHRKKNGTYKHIADTLQIVKQKNYKSDRKIKTTVNFQIRPTQSKNKISEKKILSIKSIKSIKSGTSKKNIKDSRSKKKAGPRVSLIRKIDNQTILQNSDSLGISVKDPNFAQTIFKKNTSKNLFKTRVNIQDRNVYDQLNNFHKFLNENQTIQSQRDIKRTIAKPMVIQNETNIRAHKVNTQGLKTENLMIQMGLQLVRRMNRLAQKRL